VVRPRGRRHCRRDRARLAWLVLFVIAALFGQWPLRALAGGGHILANDFGQIAHATVFAIGVAYALCWDGHVLLDVFPSACRRGTRRSSISPGRSASSFPWR
jgi:TRAP-type mannitol/chloroaromatic compound transport system permease small subunit